MPREGFEGEEGPDGLDKGGCVSGWKRREAVRKAVGSGARELEKRLEAARGS